MNVELLLAPDCPNAAAARAILADCLRQLGVDLPVRERIGEFASPSILVDGIDVMTGTPGSFARPACRLDLPTATRVLAALQRSPQSGSAQLAVGVTSTRIRPLSPAARTVHRTILRAFATTGRAPDPAELAVPRELHERDVVRLDDRDQIRAAYPFSATPTRHRVAITAGPTVYAMCAIDALGISAMLDADVAITSSDPGSGEPIAVTVRRGGHATWSPDTAVVLDGADTGAADAAADRCCRVTNFFAGTASAEAWLTAHPHVSGVILSQEEALRNAVDSFGRLLDGPA